MKKLIVMTLVCVVCVAAAHAGVKAVGVDVVNTSYIASTGLFSMAQSGLEVTITYDDGSPQGSISNAGFSLNTAYISGMNFTGGTFAFTDNSSAVILSGDVLSVDFQQAFDFLVGKGTAQVKVSNLAGYPVGPSDIVSITFELDPAFTDFEQDYTGESKVNFLVPEPATMLLMGLGAVLLRKKK
jgi:hypothetical protein